MLNFETRDISTYAKIILSEWRLLAELMALDNGAADNETDEKTHAVPVMSEEMIFTALEGPFHLFYHQFIPAYARGIRFQAELTLQQSDSFKENRASLPLDNAISEKALKKVTAEDISTALKKLTELAKSYHETWCQRLDSWQKLILDDCEKAGLNLTVLEIAEFQTYAPLPSLKNEFIERQLKFPYSEKQPVDVSKYLYAKSFLLIRNALARQQLEHGEATTASNLKKIKSAFSAIQKQESQLAKEQQKAIDEALVKLPR